MLKILDWLELHPGATWQERWDASGAGADGPADWRDQVVAELKAAGRLGPRGRPAPQARHGHGPADRRRRPPPGPCLAAGHHLPDPGRRRDGPHPRPRRDRGPEGAAQAGTVGNATFDPAVERVALIMAAKGGFVADITPGDCIELLDCCWRLSNDGTRGNRHSPFFYQLLHDAGVFPPGAPANRPDDQHPVRRAADRRAARRPLRPGLPPGPRPAGGLPARAPARHRLHLPRQAGHVPDPVLLERPREPPPRHQLPPAATRHRRRVEEAHPDQDRPRPRRRRAGRRPRVRRRRT